MSRLDIGQITAVSRRALKNGPANAKESMRYSWTGQLINAYLGLILPRPRAQHVFEDKGKYYGTVLSDSAPRYVAGVFFFATF